jgi:hypothetical protein
LVENVAFGRKKVEKIKKVRLLSKLVGNVAFCWKVEKKRKKKEEKKVGNVLPEFRRNLSSGTNSLAGRKKVGKSQKSRKVGWKRRIFAGIGYDEATTTNVKKECHPKKSKRARTSPGQESKQKKEKSIFFKT